MNHAWLRSAVFSLAVTLPVALAAQWSSDPKVGVRLDDGIPVAMELSAYPDRASGAIFSWNNFSASFAASTTNFQRIDMDGFPRWHGQDVNEPTIYNSMGVGRISAVDSDGNFYHVYQETSGFQTTVRVQKFNLDGVAQWPIEGVRVCSITDELEVESPVAIVVSEDHTVIACWAEARGYGGMHMYAQKLSADGDRLWGANGARVSATEMNATLGSDAQSDGAGGVIVAWAGLLVGSSDYNVFAQRLDATGTRLWAGSDVTLCNLPKTQSSVKVVDDGSGGSVAIWRDERGVRPEYYLQRLNANGAALWQANGIPFSLNNAQAASAVALVQDGSVWVMSRCISGYPTDNVRVQKFDLATGARQLGDAGVGVLPDYFAYDSAFATDSESGVIVAWKDNRTTAGVYSQRLNPDGEPVWQTNGMPVSTAPGEKRDVVLVPMGAANSIVGWVDERNDEGGGGSYGRYVNPFAAWQLPDGTLLGPAAAVDWALWE